MIIDPKTPIEIDTTSPLKDPYSDVTFDDINNDKREINLNKIDNIKFGDVDHSDFPDFCDAYIESADMHGHAMSDEELDYLNEDHEFIHEKLIEHLF